MFFHDIFSLCLRGKNYFELRVIMVYNRLVYILFNQNPHVSDW